MSAMRSIACTLAVSLAVTAGCKPHHDDRDKARAEPSAAEKAATAAAAAAEDERLRQIDAVVAAGPPLTLTADPCPLQTMAAPGALETMSLALGPSMSGLRPGDETSGYLLLYLRLIGSEVEVVAPLGTGAPLDARVGFGHASVTLVVDHWGDPVMPAARTGTFEIGTLLGRLLIWDPAARRIACGANVVASNGDITVVDTTSADYSAGSQEDPLSKARVDLVNEALRKGLGDLKAIAAPAGGAPPAGSAR